ncbi:endonuclease/exonuclease/phosphatase family protein [Pelagicoccus sp. SDUM812003]|uniref:endonuclease/exonuclease/phosphatase family protein n=1 Tax=Pelagicoccus sp. SDUM812003 TaxID=3041267 RepID=UPI00281046AF|nr:endonuclease/exonuclease/phosphatase family protein [Pelagicoccus sp. SDUM812003]MDQ8204761.1 endonuclease/exonuclease/phosphatase family protein [Pelagicoccus sp. SDUM812003]
MPDYQRIDTRTVEGARTAQRLIVLRDALSEIPPKTLDDNLLLATWNIRDFDKPTFGERSEEAIAYIAEIISRFDLVAVQEVYRDLKALDRVLTALGPFWKVIVSDTTEGDSGNDERMAFLYDSRKVRFGGLAGELVLPPVKTDGGSMAPAHQVWRSPYICGFEAGWSRFMICSVHILWGKKRAFGGKEPEDRIEEIRKVARFLKQRTEDPFAWARNLILLGDFNIFSSNENGAFGELTQTGEFTIPENHRAFVTNAARTKSYDQIAYRIQEDRLGWTGRAGVFDYFKYVYTEDDVDLYKDAMGDSYHTNSRGQPRSDRSKRNYYKTYWRTHQMSDHLPLWVELDIDFSKRFLRRKLDGQA